MKPEVGHLAQLSEQALSAGVSPFGLRPSGETPAAQPSAPSRQIADPQVKVKPQRAARRTFSTAYKLQVLEAYDACDNPLARGALLRKEGLYHSRLSTWRKQRDEGALKVRAKGKKSKALLNNQQLARENARLKKKLAQAEAIIEIQKKVAELLGVDALPHESNEQS